MPVGQSNPPFPAALSATPKRPPHDLIAAGLVILALLLDLGRRTWNQGVGWFASWYVVSSVVLIGVSVAALVLVLMDRNRTIARNTVVLASGMIFVNQLGSLVSSLATDYYSLNLSYEGNWLAIPAGLATLAAIILVYLVRDSDTPRPARPAGLAQPIQPGWPQPGPAQAPQWPQPAAQNPQQPTGFPAPQPPAGYAPQPGYQPAGYPQPGFAPQQQHPPVAQPPAYPQPAQQPGFGVPAAADPTILRQPPAESPIPQPPNAFGQPQDSGAEPTVLHQPGGFGAPPSSEFPAPTPPQPATAAQPSSTPDTPSTSQPPVQAGPAQPGAAPTPDATSSGPQQRPPSAQQ
ncbi:hypothetical protein [Nocardia macrotermitis]|nr:hypothetical protein [Nocardia macrotermitis]